MSWAIIIFLSSFKKKNRSLRIHSPPKATPALYQIQSSRVRLYTAPATPVRQAEADEPRNNLHQISNETKSLESFLFLFPSPVWGGILKQLKTSFFLLLFFPSPSFARKGEKVRKTRPILPPPPSAPPHFSTREEEKKIRVMPYLTPVWIHELRNVLKLKNAKPNLKKKRLFLEGRASLYSAVFLTKGEEGRCKVEQMSTKRYVRFFSV